MIAHDMLRHCLLLLGTSTTSLMVEVGGRVCCRKKYRIKKDDNECEGMLISPFAPLVIHCHLSMNPSLQSGRTDDERNIKLFNHRTHEPDCTLLNQIRHHHWKEYALKLHMPSGSLLLPVMEFSIKPLK